MKKSLRFSPLRKHSSGNRASPSWPWARQSSPALPLDLPDPCICLWLPLACNVQASITQLPEPSTLLEQVPTHKEPALPHASQPPVLRLAFVLVLATGLSAIGVCPFQPADLIYPEVNGVWGSRPLSCPGPSLWGPWVCCFIISGYSGVGAAVKNIDIKYM